MPVSTFVSPLIERRFSLEHQTKVSKPANALASQPISDSDIQAYLRNALEG
jgi:hypothetical protein